MKNYRKIIVGFLMLLMSTFSFAIDNLAEIKHLLNEKLGSVLIDCDHDPLNENQYFGIPQEWIINTDNHRGYWDGKFYKNPENRLLCL